MGRIILGMEKIRCPRCRRVNMVEIHTDLPKANWLTCAYCGHKALMYYGPLLEKYGLVPGLSRQENRQFGRHIKKDVAKLHA
jgi:DNA-directed RNA polymerase subunit RPC12/RpoP